MTGVNTARGCLWSVIFCVSFHFQTGKPRCCESLRLESNRKTKSVKNEVLGSAPGFFLLIFPPRVVAMAFALQ